MKICPVCSEVVNDEMKFCSKCGNDMSAVVPMSEQPTVCHQPVEPVSQQYAQPQYGQYQQPYNPQQNYNQYQPTNPQPVSKSGKIMAIISMILGIEGIIQGVIMPIVTLMFAIGMASVSYSSYYGYSYAEDMIGACVYMLIVNILGVATGVAAVILASKSRAKGFRSGMSGAGKGLGIATIVLSGIAVILSFASFGVLA